MEIRQKASIHNRFDIEVIDARTGELKQTFKAENVILNQMWEHFCATNGWGRFIQFGSGTGTPSANDTALFDYEGSTTLGSGEISIDNQHGVAYMRRSCRLTEQQYVGVSFTEVGLGWAGSDGYLSTHAMMEDMNGNPVSIVKTDADIFNIYATVFVHWTDTEHIGFGNNSYYLSSLLGLLFGVNDGNYNYGYYKKSPSSYTNTGVSQKTATLDAVNKKITVEYYRKPANEGNLGGFKYLSIVQQSENYQYNTAWVIMPVEDFYEGDDIVGEAIGTGDGSTTRFSTKFDFPENATIYVNGSAVSGVTVLKAPCNFNSSKYLCDYLTKLDDRSTSGNVMLTPDRPFYGNSYGSQTNVQLKRGMIMNDNNLVGFEKVKLYTYHYDTGSYDTKLYGSNDCGTWTLIAETTDPSSQYPVWQEFNLDSTSGHYKYYKVVSDWGESTNCVEFINTSADFCNIVFDTAPANGAVITADYHTPCIAKDSDHVLDTTIVFQFGEYSE